MNLKLWVQFAQNQGSFSLKISLDFEEMNSQLKVTKLLVGQNRGNRKR
jgi:hypothetical protein